jgi:hypothetical protein
VIELGLTRSEFKEYEQALVSDHAIKVKVRLLDSSEKTIDSLTDPFNRIVSGSVQVDVTGEITRSLDLTILDPRHQLKFDAGSAANGALYADRFVAVEYCVWVAALERWVEVPVFWGPITGFSRQGGEITLEAQGKESLLMEPHYVTFGYELKEGDRIDESIRRVASKMGESRFDLPRIKKDRLQKDIAVSSQDIPWQVLRGGSDEVDATEDDATKQGLQGMLRGDRVLGYDGRGRLGLRNRKRPPVYTFREDRDIVSPVSFSYDMLELRNAVCIKGGEERGRGKKKASSGVIPLQKRHPLSPDALARNGVPLYKVEWIEKPGAKSDEEAEELAREQLDSMSEQLVEPSFECLPFPHLEEYDRCRLRSEDGWLMSFQLTSFTIPLTAEEPMTIGGNREVEIRRRGSKKRHGGGSAHVGPGPSLNWGSGKGRPSF